VNPVVVEAQQLVEREPVAALRGGNQGGVIEVAGNASSVSNTPRTSRDVGAQM
jgi:hypothetical protein